MPSCAYSNKLQLLLTIFSGFASAIILTWLLWYSNYGFDFTDESFYLNWISNPSLYSVSLTQFGFFYHPLFELVGYDITCLRQINILATFCLAWILASHVISSIASGFKPTFVQLNAAAGLATSALVLFDSWLFTPSYNSLALQGLMVTAIGVILLDASPDRKYLLACVITGIGGWLVFMAKPSTAIALAFAVVSYLLVTGKFSVWRVLLCASISLLLLSVSAVLIDGSILSFVRRLYMGLQFGAQLGGGHTLRHMLRIDGFHLNINLILTFILISLACGLAVWGTVTTKWIGAFICTSILFAFFIATILLAFGIVRPHEGLGPFQGLLIFSMFFVGSLAIPILEKTFVLKSLPKVKWGTWAFFLVMPHVFAFGSNVNAWQTGSSAGIFWLLAGVIAFAPILQKKETLVVIFPIVFATQMVTATLLGFGLEHPYRQPQALWRNDVPLKVEDQKSTLILPAEYGRYLEEAISKSQSAGFKRGSPMIDLSGQSPGTLFMLGAESIGQAWTIGGYPGSLDLAKSALDLVQCEKIAAAWVLLEPGGPRSISTTLLEQFGARFPDAYILVGRFQTAEGSGGYNDKRGQELYKPKNSVQIVEACEALRQAE